MSMLSGISPQIRSLVVLGAALRDPILFCGVRALCSSPRIRSSPRIPTLSYQPLWDSGLLKCPYWVAQVSAAHPALLSSFPVPGLESGGISTISTRWARKCDTQKGEGLCTWSSSYRLSHGLVPPPLKLTKKGLQDNRMLRSKPVGHSLALCHTPVWSCLENKYERDQKEPRIQPLHFTDAETEAKRG